MTLVLALALFGSKLRHMTDGSDSVAAVASPGHCFPGNFFVMQPAR